MHLREGNGHSDDNESTLDIFYLSQIVSAIYRSTDQFDFDNSDYYPSADEFDKIYAQHHELLNQDAWKQYYSSPFLAQATSARFWRLPDLQDLPDSSDPIRQVRPHRGIGHFTKLPRWAYNARRTRQRQPTLSMETMTQLALSTLQQSIVRLREAGYTSVQPYSETQARYWLDHMCMDQPTKDHAKKWVWDPNQFGVFVGQGAYDVWQWEAYYSRDLWESVEARNAFVQRDLDGTRESEVSYCGMPDGGLGAEVFWRGWEPEVGSHEEIAFLAAVAVKETEGIIGSVNLDYTMRSHMLWGVMRLAFESDQMERYMEDLKRQIVQAGRIDEETKAGQWIQEALKVMEPYVQKVDAKWPAAVEDQSELLRSVLMENGQLFARWRILRPFKEFDFELRSRE